MFYDVAQRRLYEWAFRQAHAELGRAPTEGELVPYLTPCQQEVLGIAPDGIEELEAVLVPCGC